MYENYLKRPDAPREARWSAPPQPRWKRLHRCDWFDGAAGSVVHTEYRLRLDSRVLKLHRYFQAEQYGRGPGFVIESRGPRLRLTLDLRERNAEEVR